MTRFRAACGLPFFWIALLLLKISECFSHFGELVADEPCACDAFRTEAADERP